MYSGMLLDPFHADLNMAANYRVFVVVVVVFFFLLQNEWFQTYSLLGLLISTTEIPASQTYLLQHAT